MFSTEIPTSRASSFFVIFCVLLGLTGLLDAEPVQQPLQSGKNIECTTLRQLIPYRTVRKCAERFVPKPASRFLDTNWEYQSYAYSNMFGKVRLIPDLSCKNCHRPEMQAILKKLTAYKQKQSPGGSSEALAGTTGFISLCYTKLAFTDGKKFTTSAFAFGAVLYFLAAALICLKGVEVQNSQAVPVDEVYRDVREAQNATYLERARLAALAQQAKFGDAPAPTYLSFNSIVQFLTGFSRQTQVQNPENPNLSREIWTAMRGMPKANASRDLLQYSCKMFRRIDEQEAKVVPVTSAPGDKN